MVSSGRLAVNSLILASLYLASNILAIQSVLSETNISSSTWNKSSFVHIGFYMDFKIIPAYRFSAEIDVYA